MKKTLRIWALTDGKAGHQNQTEGLIQALGQYREVELSWMPLLSFGMVVKMWLFKRCARKHQSSPDLIIAAGHKTHGSLLAYQRCYAGKSVLIMSPSLPLSWFDLCLVPRHDSPKPATNVIETIGAMNKVASSASHLSEQGLILLGGPSKHFDWDSAKILQQLSELMAANPKVTWLLASSRRTPAECYDAFKQQFPDIEWVAPDDVDADWLPKQLQTAGQVWVSEDSISMIYEALTAGASTGILTLGRPRSTRITQEVDRLLAEGRLHADFSAVVGDHQATPLNEADRCSQALLKKLDL